jgi:NAD(P)-dependent dehydrogenase (short-subunit alcohol dehydrogenase family)
VDVLEPRPDHGEDSYVGSGRLTAELEHLGEGSAFGRPAQPPELAGAFVYLASPEATYVTGATIAVTGGEFFS